MDDGTRMVLMSIWAREGARREWRRRSVRGGWDESGVDEVLLLPPLARGAPSMGAVEGAESPLLAVLVDAVRG